MLEVPSILPRFDFRADFGVASDTGSKRTANEDAHCIARHGLNQPAACFGSVVSAR